MGALRRLAHVTVMAVLALSMTLFATLGGLWIWSGTEGSLATAAQLAVRFLPNLFPDSQTEPVLVLQGVTGTVREGGTVALVRWQHAGQTVEVQNLQVQWDWRALRDGRLRHLWWSFDCPCQSTSCWTSPPWSGRVHLHSPYRTFRVTMCLMVRPTGGISPMHKLRPEPTRHKGTCRPALQWR